MPSQKLLGEDQRRDRARLPKTRQLQVAIGLSAVCLYLLVIGVVISGQVHRTDFIVPYTGGFILQHGDASKLYDLNQQMAVQEHVLKRRGLLIDPYPPFHALFFAPLSTLDYRNAYLAWGTINVFLWLLFMYVLRRDTGFNRQPVRNLALCTLFFPLWLAILQGQLSLFILVAYTLTYAYLNRKREYAAGLCLGLGLIKFQAVLGFALIGLLRKKWSFVLGFASVGSLLGILSLAVLGPAGVHSYVKLVLDMMKHPANPVYGGIRPWDMPTIVGFITGVFGGRIPSQWAGMVATCLSSGLILLVVWRWKIEERRQNGAAFDLIFASAMTISLVATPHLLAHDLTAMILAVVLVVNSPQWSQKSHERWILSVAIAILYAGYFCLLMLHYRTGYIVATTLVIFALAALSLARNSRWKELELEVRLACDSEEGCDSNPLSDSVIQTKGARGDIGRE